jgi:hypothetical protein
MTAKTKWDGVGFVLNDDMNLATILVEFSGGVYFNSTEKKSHRDELKVLPGTSDIIDYYEAKHGINIPGYFVRFHST